MALRTVGVFVSVCLVTILLVATGSPLGTVWPPIAALPVIVATGHAPILGGFAAVLGFLPAGPGWGAPVPLAPGTGVLLLLPWLVRCISRRPLSIRRVPEYLAALLRPPDDQRGSSR